jgi:hypothetical protein
MGDIRVSQMQHSSNAVGKVQEPPSSAHSLPDGLRSPSISGSTPEGDLDNEIELPDHEPDLDDGLDQDSKELQPPQPQKRKGGRKPVGRNLCDLHEMRVPRRMLTTKLRN